MHHAAPPQLLGGPQAPTPEEREHYRQQGLLWNFGFRRVERRAGNVGYLDLSRFFDPELAGETAVAAMRLVAYTWALIIDLRWTSGGHAGMVTLLCSYLLGLEPAHLHDFYWRDGDPTEQVWTLPYVRGPRLTDVPVYFLTSSQTSSGAESFAYFLQNRKRATVVVEQTRGGAHYTHGIRIREDVEAVVPAAAAYGEQGAA